MKSNSFKKAKVFILILSILVSLLTPALNVSAESTEDGFVYTINKDKVTITDYNGSAVKVAVPAEIEGKPVKSIGTSAFYECSKIEEIIIPEGVEYIGDSAFIFCSSLQSITLPDSINTIRPDAFRYCRALTSISLPNGLTEIKDGCFSNCSALTEITIPDTVTVIEECAFYGCKELTAVTIPESVKILGDAAFSGCTKLSSLTLPDNMTHIGYNLVDDTALYKNPNNWEGPALYLNTYLLTTDKDKMTDGYTIKEGTTLLCEYSFKSCETLTTIVLPDSLEYIDKDAFTYCYNLKSLIIPEGVKAIRETAFECCYKLESIVIPESVTYISNSAFSLCPENIAIIGYANSYAHQYASMMNIDFYALDETLPYPPNEGYRIGDADLNGSINVKDATTIQKHLSGIINLHEIALLLADADGNSDVNIKDATLIQKYIAGIYF